MPPDQLSQHIPFHGKSPGGTVALHISPPCLGMLPSWVSLSKAEVIWKLCTQSKEKSGTPSLFKTTLVLVETQALLGMKDIDTGFLVNSRHQIQKEVE